MLFIIQRHVGTKMGPECPSTFTTDACHADALIRQDTCIKLRDTARRIVCWVVFTAMPKTNWIT